LCCGCHGVVGGGVACGNRARKDGGSRLDVGAGAGDVDPSIVGRRPQVPERFLAASVIAVVVRRVRTVHSPFCAAPSLKGTHDKVGTRSTVNNTVRPQFNMNFLNLAKCETTENYLDIFIRPTPRQTGC